MKLYGRLIVRNECMDIDYLSKIGLFSYFTASEGKALEINASTLD